MIRSSQRGARAAFVDVLFISGLSLAMLACTNSILIDPTFGAACRVGTLAPGRGVDGALNEDSCIDSHSLLRRTQTAYESYDLQFEKGAAYQVVMTHRPDPRRLGRDGLDPVLELWGRNPDGGSRPLAISLDEADGTNAELLFVAPETRRMQVIAGAFDPYYEAERLGGYSLRVEECPMLGTLTEDTLTAFILRESRCERRGLRDDETLQGQPIRYSFVSFVADSGTTVTLSVEADDFTPVWEPFGPGWDSFDRLRNKDRRANVVGESPISGYFRERTHVSVGIAAFDPTGPSRQVRIRKRVSLGEPK